PGRRRPGSRSGLGYQIRALSLQASRSRPALSLDVTALLPRLSVRGRLGLPARLAYCRWMRVHVVSDVHGRADALRKAGDGADALICLGDLLLFIDYADYSQGIFPNLFGPERARTLVELRTAGRFDEARALSAQLWAGLDGDPRAHIE